MKPRFTLVLAFVLSALFAVAQPGGGGDPGHGSPCAGAYWNQSGPGSNAFASGSTYNFSIPAVNESNPASTTAIVTVTNTTSTGHFVVQQFDGTTVNVFLAAGASHDFAVSAAHICNPSDGLNSLPFTIKLGSGSGTGTVVLKSVSGQYNALGTNISYSFSLSN